MYEALTLILIALRFPYGGQDPEGDEEWRGRRALRELECESITQEEAHRLRPGRVPEESPRGTVFFDWDARLCHRRMIPWGERAPRDELVLDTLHDDVAAMVQTAIATEGSDVTWSVDAFYPDVDVTSRIASAGRTEIAERGLKVSNTAPLLAAGDLLVLRHIDVQDALPIACQRYEAEHAMGPNDAFLALALVDTRESKLHAGVCRAGQWRWLQ